MRIATWNVNSIKQRMDNALAWLTECRPDLVCLQDHSDVDIETAIRTRPPATDVDKCATRAKRLVLWH